MTPAEWIILCKNVEAKWGQSRRWDRAGDLALDKNVSDLPLEWAEKALDELASQDNAPAPVKVLRQGRDIQRRLEVGTTSPSLANPLECSHPQPWGFDIIDGKRIAFCRYCYSEWAAPNVKSMGEIAEARETRNIPT